MSELINLISLLKRPREPTIMLKLKRDVDDEFDDSTAFEEDDISIDEIIGFDKIVKVVSRDDDFSIFLPAHSEIAGKLIRIFLEPSIERFAMIAEKIRDQVNVDLFHYALSVALLNRRDTKHLKLPHNFTTFPERYFPATVLNKAREQHATKSFFKSTVFANTADDLVEFSKDYMEPENRLIYFREDVGVNLHHWHWHLVYPFELDAKDIKIVDKDRRGELFYYMHEQLLARYNFERLSNHLPLVERLNDFRKQIPEAYFTNIIMKSSQKPYGSRVKNLTLKDVNRDKIFLDVGDLERWRDRIHEAIQQGYIVDEAGKQFSLMNDDNSGINLLGNIVESSMLSKNRNLYGNMHNMGHMIISYAHDPDKRYLQNDGVMGETSTAMRDPIFYRWHGFINDLFQLHKRKLPAYTKEQLEFKSVQVKSVKVKTSSDDVKLNVLKTSWEKATVDIKNGLDFAAPDESIVTITHLQHERFTITIEVNNYKWQTIPGTVRIFMAPKYQPPYRKEWSFNDQRLMMIELDKFEFSLKPGRNIIERSSKDSSVTIPFSEIFGSQSEDAGFCGCGWPDYML